MTLPVINLSVDVAQVAGTGYANAKVVLDLTRGDIYAPAGQPSQLVPAGRITIPCDASGHGTAQAFPNALGTQQTGYRVTVYDQDGNQVFPEERRTVLASLPDIDCRLQDYLYTVPPASKADADAATDSARAYRDAAAASKASVDFLYPGTYATPPLTRPDGSPVQAGDRYNSSADGFEYRFVGGAWSSSEKNSLASQTSAAGSAASAAHIYQGIYAADPLTRNDGSPCQEGDMAVFTGNVLKTFNGAGVWAVQTAASSSDLADSTNAALGAALVGVDGDNLRGLYLSAKPMQSYTPLRAYTGSATSVRVTQKGIGGVFWRDDADVATADDGGTVIVDGSGRRWKRLREYGRYMASWFGAVLDGVTNCTAALALASAAIQATGGTLEIGQGTCIVGAQTFAGATGKGYAYKPADIVKIIGCTMPIVIEGGGVKFKFADGLKYGSFDPVTGAVYNPTLPFTNQDYNSQLGEVIWVENNASISIHDLEIDGNQAALTLGGYWGDTGRQCTAFGVYAYGNKSFELRNANLHHLAADGLCIGWSGLTLSSDRYPHTLVNVSSTYSGRNNFTWAGGNALLAMNCKFNHAGRSVIVSSPTAGIDIETDPGTYCQGGRFVNCEFVDNVAPQMIADSGTSFDVEFDQCTFIGSIWPRMPRFTFRNCKVHGQVINPYGSDSEEDRVKFIGGLISDEIIDGYTPDPGSGLIFPTALASPMLLDGVTIRATRNKVGRLDCAILRRVRMELNAGTESGIVDTDWYSIGYGAQIEDLTVVTNIANAPANGYLFMTINGTEIWRGKNTLTNSGAGQVRWNSWSPGSGYAGVFGNSNGGTVIPLHRLELGIAMRGDNYYGAVSTYAGLSGSIPAGYVVSRGDRILNDAPSAGGVPGWIVTTGGTTGSTAVVKAMANIAP